MSLNAIYKEEKVKRSPLKVFRVKSKTNRDPTTEELLEYRVELWLDKKMYCNCMWGQRGNKRILCWHITKVKQELEKEFGTIEKAIEHYRNEKI